MHSESVWIPNGLVCMLFNTGKDLYLWLVLDTKETTLVFLENCMLGSLGVDYPYALVMAYAGSWREGTELRGLYCKLSSQN